MVNEAILAYAFLDASYRKCGAEFRLWHEFYEGDVKQHLITAKLFASKPEMTPCETHGAWVERRLADGWSQGEVVDAEQKTHTQLVAFEKLPALAQEAEIAGVDAMRLALPYAEKNVLPPNLEFEMMKRIAVSNANFYLEAGEALGLDPNDQPSSMLLWGSLANARHHLQLLEAGSSLNDQHIGVLDEGLKELNRVRSETSELPMAKPGCRRDQGPFECQEDDLEHGLISNGAAYMGNVLGIAFKEANDKGYCDRCLAASQVGSSLSVLISGARNEGMNDAEILTVISDLILHGFKQADAGEPVPHDGPRSETLQ